MIRRLPILPTIIVLAAVATMIGLGFWQLDRLKQKEALIARYTAAADAPAVAWPADTADVEAALFRHSAVTCERVNSRTAVAGHNAVGETGWAHVATCETGEGGQAEVVLGWSNNPAEIAWAGGAVAGTIGPGRGDEARLIADPPLAGLQANAAPDPNDIPNNHLAYAVQWFFFAASALVIYALAVRKRLKS